MMCVSMPPARPLPTTPTCLFRVRRLSSPEARVARCLRGVHALSRIAPRARRGATPSMISRHSFFVHIFAAAPARATAATACPDSSSCLSPMKANMVPTHVLPECCLLLASSSPDAQSPHVTASAGTPHGTGLNFFPAGARGVRPPSPDVFTAFLKFFFRCSSPRSRPIAATTCQHHPLCRHTDARCNGACGAAWGPPSSRLIEISLSLSSSCQPNGTLIINT